MLLAFLCLFSNSCIAPCRLFQSQKLCGAGLLCLLKNSCIALCRWFQTQELCGAGLLCRVDHRHVSPLPRNMQGMNQLIGVFPKCFH